MPVICFDFDGTLVDDEGRIHPRDVEILAGERSVAFIPATGRPLHSVRHTFERHGLFVDGPIPFPLVLENGAAVYLADEVLYAQHSFTPLVQAALVRTALAYPQLTFLLFGLNQVRVMWPSEAGREMIRRFALDARPFTTGDSARPLTKLAAFAEAVEPLRAFEAETRDLALERAYSLPTVLEFQPVGVDKGSGLTALLDDERYSGAEVVVAGDGENDLALFDLATLTFVPQESPAPIQARADHLVDVRENGLLAPILQVIGSHP